jgi:hypothetical protein
VLGKTYRVSLDYISNQRKRGQSSIDETSFDEGGAKTAGVREADGRRSNEGFDDFLKRRKMEEQDAVKQRKIVRAPIEKALKLVLKTMSNLKVALLPPQFARDNPLEDAKKLLQRMLCDVESGCELELLDVENHCANANLVVKSMKAFC